MNNTSFSPTKPQNVKQKPKEEFNKQLNQIIELSLISIKQHARQAKKVFNTDSVTKLNIEKQMQQQISENNHLVYNYLIEEDKTVLQYLLMGLYNIFLGYKEKESMFQRFRILNEESLKLQIQDNIILEKRIQDKNKIIEESKDMIKELQQKIDNFDVRIDSARSTITKSKKRDDKQYQMQNDILAKDQYINDIKRQSTIQLEELKNENTNLSQRLSILQQDRQSMENTIKNIKKSNQELDLALKKSNLVCKQLSEKIQEIDDTNSQFIAKGQTILSSVMNGKLNGSSTRAFDSGNKNYSLDKQQLPLLNNDIQQFNENKVQFIGISTPQSPENVNLHLLQYQQQTPLKQV